MTVSPTANVAWLVELGLLDLARAAVNWRLAADERAYTVATEAASAVSVCLRDWRCWLACGGQRAVHRITIRGD